MSKDIKQWTKDRPSLSNYNSVRINNPHKKFVTMELFSPTQFTIRFNRFYCEILKKTIQMVPSARFLMDYRAWVIDISVYKAALTTIKPICLEKHIHIEEIPDFCLNLILYPVPGSGVEQESGSGMGYIYTADPFTKAKVSDLPDCISKALYFHQQKAICRILKRNGRMILNDDMVSIIK